MDLYKCSSTCTSRIFVNLTFSILFPFIVISALSVLYFIPFGVNIMNCSVKPYCDFV